MAVVEHASEVVTLDNLAVTVRTQDELARAAVVAAVQHAILAGEALLLAQGMIPRGQWEDWLLTTSISKSLSRRYMRLAQYKHLIADEYSISGAIRLLTTQGQTRNGPGQTNLTRMAVHHLKQRGRTRREIAAELNISSNSVKYYIASPESHLRRSEAARAAHRENTRLRKVRQEVKRQAARDQTMRNAGAGLSECYSLIRRTAQKLDHLYRTGETQEIKQASRLALSRVHAAEDELVKAVRTA